MASRALAACAKGGDDYAKVYGKLLEQVSEPVIIHWLGEMFDPALAGYWGSPDLDRATETLVALVGEHAPKIDGVKISLLHQAPEIAVRRRFPRGVRMYTGDDFDYPTTIQDRKSTRLNSSHLVISYAVFCLKKKKAECSRSRVRIGGVRCFLLC